MSIFPFFAIQNGSLGFRFFLVSPLFISIFIFRYHSIKSATAWALAAVFISLSLISWRAYDPAVYDPPNGLYVAMTNKLTTRFDFHQYPLVIAHKGLAEVIIFKTDFDALNWAPPQDANPGHVLRIVHNLDYYHFRKFLDDSEMEQVVRLSTLYYAAPEKIWNKFVVVLKEKKEGDILKRIIEGKNPLEQRPYFLSKGKISGN